MRLLQKTSLKRLLLILCLIPFTLLALSWIIGSFLLAPAPSRSSLQLPGEPVQFPSSSGSQLRGNLIHGKPGKGCIILMHGVRGSRAAMAGHAAMLAAQDYTVLYFDFQAHGESPGKMITNGYLESHDASAAIAYVREIFPNERLAILGASLGAAAALLAQPPLRVDAMILEMVYPDLDRAVKNRMALIGGDWIRPLSPFLTWQNKIRVGVSTDWFSPIRQIPNLNCPKLIIGGKQDRHTTLQDTQAIFDAAGEPKQLWIIDGAKHENLRARNPDQYDARILTFLQNCLTRQ